MKPLSTYLKLCTEFYDREPHHNASQAEAFYLEQAIKANGPILEPMCGTGRFLIPMLQAGLDAQGFDASEHMLDALRQKCTAVGIASPPIWQQFVQDFKHTQSDQKSNSDKQFGMIFVPYGSWGLITQRDDTLQGLVGMYEALKVDGKFFLEIETVHSVSYPLDVWRSSDHVREDGSLLAVHLLPSYNPTTQLFRASCRYESLINGVIIESETEHFEQYLYRVDEMDELLTQAGFTSIKKYQNYDKAPTTNKEIGTIIYECTKNPTVNP